MKFTINRASWRCGHSGPNQHGIGPTQLLNSEGFMCCLGQISLQLGLDKEDILEKDCPHNIHQTNILSRYDMGYYEYEDTELAKSAMDINDDGSISNQCREDALKILFAEAGHTVEFIGNYSPEEK